MVSKIVYDRHLYCVRFQGSFDGEEVRCAITAQALRKYFGAKGLAAGEQLLAFEQHEHDIEGLSAEMFRDGRTTRSGVVFVRTQDVRPYLERRAGMTTGK